MQSKSKHYRDELRESKGNTSKTWKIVRDIVPGSKNLNSGRNYSDISINVANKFNDFFVNVGKNIYDRTQILVQGENVPHFNFSTVTAGGSASFRPQPVDTETVILTIKSLNDTSSIGANGIPMKFNKDALYVIAYYLTFIINTSIVTGVFPTLWKHALVIPVFKNGDVRDQANYRPISLLPIISKFLEKVVTNQLMQFFRIQQTSFHLSTWISP